MLLCQCYKLHPWGLLLQNHDTGAAIDRGMLRTQSPTSLPRWWDRPTQTAALCEALMLEPIESQVAWLVYNSLQKKSMLILHRFSISVVKSTSCSVSATQYPSSNARVVQFNVVRRRVGTWDRVCLICLGTMYDMLKMYHSLSMVPFLCGLMFAWLIWMCKCLQVQRHSSLLSLILTKPNFSQRLVYRHLFLCVFHTAHPPVSTGVL